MLMYQPAVHSGDLQRDRGLGVETFASGLDLASHHRRLCGTWGKSIAL